MDLDPGRVQAGSFGTWAAWDWRRPIALDPSAPAVGAPEDPARIALPMPPVRSCSDGYGAAALAMLSEALYAAWEAVEAALAGGRDPLPELCAPPPLHRHHHAAWAVIIVEAPGPVGLPAAVGRVRGRTACSCRPSSAPGSGGAPPTPEPEPAVPVDTSPPRALRPDHLAELHRARAAGP